MRTSKDTSQPTPQPRLTWMFPSGWLRRWPPPRVPEDALAIFTRWRAAAQLGHKTAAHVELTKLEKLAERTPSGDE
jgi:hypothetical protein